MNNRSEQILYLKLQSGDEEAYTELYQLYNEPIYRFIYFRVSNEALAEDMMQEVFLRFFEARDKERITKIRAYLYQIARNLIVDFYKAKEKQPLISLESTKELVSNLGKSAIESQAEIEILSQTIMKLKESWRELIILRYIDGLDYDEISKIVSRSQSYIRVNLHRARKELNKFFKF